MHIALAGCDGAGKSSHTDAIVSRIHEFGLDTVVTREPGGTELGSKIRELFLHGDAMSAEVEALLMYADRVDHVENVIAPALNDFKVVVSDRSLFCTAAFQLASGLADGHLESLQCFVKPEHWPSHVLLFDVDTDVAMERISRERGLDRMEAKDADYHRQVRANYLDLASQYAEHFTVIDASQPIDAVRKDVEREIDLILSSSFGKALLLAQGR